MQLEDEPHLLVAEAVQVLDRGQVLSSDQYLPLGGAVEGADEVQQGGFAAARRPHHRQQLTLPHDQVDPVQGPHRAAVAEHFG